MLLQPSNKSTWFSLPHTGPHFSALLNPLSNFIRSLTTHWRRPPRSRTPGHPASIHSRHEDHGSSSSSSKYHSSQSAAARTSQCHQPAITVWPLSIPDCRWVQYLERGGISFSSELSQTVNRGARLACTSSISSHSSCGRVNRQSSASSCQIRAHHITPDFRKERLDGLPEMGVSVAGEDDRKRSSGGSPIFLLVQGVTDSHAADLGGDRCLGLGSQDTSSPVTLAPLPCTPLHSSTDEMLRL